MGSWHHHQFKGKGETHNATGPNLVCGDFVEKFVLQDI
jgi:hypothetical protein